MGVLGVCVCGGGDINKKKHSRHCTQPTRMEIQRKTRSLSICLSVRLCLSLSLCVCLSLSVCLCLSQSRFHMHTHARARIHARTHGRTDGRTHARSPQNRYKFTRMERVKDNIAQHLSEQHRKFSSAFFCPVLFLPAYTAAKIYLRLFISASC